ncbi:beta-ketoacyl synthase N-terminal-like domain-containing protein [Streptomyces triticirhizae]|uniref:Beta-ketoacyl synthase N-terminal domain-containing protein n=1 Tax=Streptomyces triticirhizae TaxID=2483353 RepID=A0A3M2M8L2_9ACTN|nr:beta-ketoacyl synthase N-terminal-like domain-containing protein [Streptomyces triticirhizae]RMI45183.1 hypothetical protein EBN88_03890 [Streptomyces triticirhizae]
MTVTTTAAAGAGRAAARPGGTLRITGCGVLSAAGQGLDALAEALHGARAPVGEPTADPPADFPPAPLRPVTPLDIREFLGRRGTRKLDRFSSLGLAASRLALGGPPPEGEDRSTTGVVLATSTGSLRSLAAVARDTLVQELPYLVDPSMFPNTVMNSCAGQIAIWNGLRGLNATVATGQTSSLAALRHARTALARGRADRLLVGGVEELTPAVAWGRHRAGGLEPDTPLGEGAALFVVEPAGGEPAGGEAADRTRGTSRDARPETGAETGAGAVSAEVLAVEIGYAGGPAGRPGGLALGLADCLSRALARAGVEAGEVDVVATGADRHLALAGAEERALRRVLPRAADVRRLSVAEVLGDCYSASGALQLAALLADWRASDSAERIGLVTSVGGDGNVACAVVCAPGAR